MLADYSRDCSHQPFNTSSGVGPWMLFSVYSSYAAAPSWPFLQKSIFYLSIQVWEATSVHLLDRVSFYLWHTRNTQDSSKRVEWAKRLVVSPSFSQEENPLQSKWQPHVADFPCAWRHVFCIGLFGLWWLIFCGHPYAADVETRATGSLHLGQMDSEPLLLTTVCAGRLTYFIPGTSSYFLGTQNEKGIPFHYSPSGL